MTVSATTAMHLLQFGARIDVVALCLGHKSPTTNHQYSEADLPTKARALAWLQGPDTATFYPTLPRNRLADRVPQVPVIM